MTWEFRGDSIFLRVAAGSSENLKPDLIMDTISEISPATVSDKLGGDGANSDSLRCPAMTLNGQSFTYRRLEMYADTGKDGKRNLVTLESLGGVIH